MIIVTETNILLDLIVAPNMLVTVAYTVFSPL